MLIKLKSNQDCTLRIECKKSKVETKLKLFWRIGFAEKEVRLLFCDWILGSTFVVLFMMNRLVEKHVLWSGMKFQLGHVERFKARRNLVFYCVPFLLPIFFFLTAHLKPVLSVVTQTQIVAYLECKLTRALIRCLNKLDHCFISYQ